MRCLLFALFVYLRMFIIIICFNLRVPRQAEITDFDITFLINENVRRFYIAMNYTCRMNIIYTC